MGKLLSIQKQIQENVDTVINKAEEQYLTLTEKTVELTNKAYDQQKQLVVKFCAQLRELNSKAGDASAKLIAKVEKEPSVEEKAKEAVDKAADVTKTAIEKAAIVAEKAANKAKAVAEATA